MLFRSVAGQIGALERCIYTVIGDAVNVAARLEAMTKDVGQHILMNHATYAGLREHPEIVCLPLGEHKVKGRTEPVNVYAVTGLNALAALEAIPALDNLSTEPAIVP